MRPIVTQRADGWTWPLCDTESFDQIMPFAKTVPEIVAKFCLPHRRRVAIQAGGHCGLYPRFLSECFHQVITFEPDFQNFYCLAINADMENVTKINAAIGRHPGSCSLDRAEHNTGCTRIANASVNANGPCVRMTIDQLVVTHVDLIWLDVEGYELFALLGAERHLRNWHPVVIFEDNGLSDTYGVPPGEPRAFLEAMDYVAVERIGHDQVMVPK